MPPTKPKRRGLIVQFSVSNAQLPMVTYGGGAGWVLPNSELLIIIYGLSDQIHTQPAAWTSCLRFAKQTSVLVGVTKKAYVWPIYIHKPMDGALRHFLPNPQSSYM